MPTTYVKKLASKHGVSTRKAEQKWAEAKKAAAKEGEGENYAYVTSIFKKMMHEAAVMRIGASARRRIREFARQWEDDFFSTLCMTSMRAFQEGSSLAIRGHFRSAKKEIRSGVTFLRDLGEDDTRIYRMAYWTRSENVRPEDILPEVVSYVDTAAKHVRLKRYDSAHSIPFGEPGVAVVFNKQKNCIDIITKHESEIAE
jgi:hypothetical protein